VGIHSGDAGYDRYLNDWEPQGSFQAFRHSPLRMMLSSDRPPYETMAALVCQGLFDRFPNVRVASIESGSEWVPILVKKLTKAFGQMPSAFTSDPVETFRRHVWVAPFYEDNLAVLGELLGVDRILFGSDWPHAEGLPEPKDFAVDLRRHRFDETDIRTIMRDNGRVLTVRAS
jgi:predicted TIM-barrel fold metal-dependent hydrolase